MTEDQRGIQNIIEQMKQQLAERKASFEEERVKWEKFEAGQISALFQLQRHLAADMRPRLTESSHWL